MIEALQKASDDGNRLVSVREALLEPGYSLISDIELEFEGCTVVVSAIEEFDTISISLSTLPESRAFTPAANQFWQGCIGKQLQWAWLLKNHQGYIDGVRLEFFDPDSPGSVIGELIVAASSLQLYVSVLKA